MEYEDDFAENRLKDIEIDKINMEVLRNPKQLSALSIALLKSEAFDTLLAISSKPIHDRLICFNGMNIFIWNQIYNINQLLYNIDYKSTEVPYYKVFDEGTVKCNVGFYTGHQILAVFLLYKERGVWSYHDIKSYESLDCFQEFSRNWFKSLVLAKKDFELRSKESGCNEVTDEDHDYWNSYIDAKIDAAKELKNCMEENADGTLEDIGYWDQY